MIQGGYMVSSLVEGNRWFIYRDLYATIQVDVVWNNRKQRVVRSSIKMPTYMLREVKALLLSAGVI